MPNDRQFGGSVEEEGMGYGIYNWIMAMEMYMDMNTGGG